ncbi:MAG: hypothetical protein KAW02_06900 [candidate division Zixibacteria bacterium]|nr:hypothetical protein [candidate division Zixibacteria bacterium]
MLNYRKFLLSLAPVLNQPVIKLILTLISLAFYFVSLDLLNSLMIIIKRRLTCLMNHLQGRKFPEDEQD